MSRFSKRMRAIVGRGGRDRGRGKPSNPKEAAKRRRDKTIDYIREFNETRVGVEAYIEPATAATSATILLIATTGEWTRRAVPSGKAGWSLARDLGIPVYDVLKTGYPPRMRAWTRRRRGR